MRPAFPLLFSTIVMDVNSLWISILGEVELEVSRANFASFFKGTQIRGGGAEGSFEILCPNTASLVMLKSRFYFLVKSIFEKRLNREVSLSFSVAQFKTNSPSVAPGPLFSVEAPSFEDVLRKARLNPNFSFESFAVSETNQMAYAAAQAVAKKIGKAYNPLFVWGTTGVGKTHLMQALGRQAVLENPRLKIVYCTGEDFTNGIIEAIGQKSTHLFKKKYRDIDLLLVDDVQFIAGREAVQMEFFHTFNSIIQSGGQVVLTSDRPPREISKLESRLRSRFEGGLTVDVSNPTFELRTAIVLIKAGERKISLPIDVAKSLAAAFEDVRALEGALLRFSSEQGAGNDTNKALSKVTRQPLETNNAQRKKTTNPTKIVEVVSSHFNLKVSQIKGPKRKKHIAEARQVLMYVLRQDLGLSFDEIGEALGGRDHSTIIHGVEKIGALLPRKENLRLALSQIRQYLWG